MCCIFHKPYHCILSHKYMFHSLEVHQHSNHACYKATGLHLDKLLKANTQKYIIIIPPQSIQKVMILRGQQKIMLRNQLVFHCFFLTDKVTCVWFTSQFTEPVSHHDHSDKGLDLVTPINFRYMQFSNHKNCPYIIYLKMTCNRRPFQEMRDPKNEVASQTKE